VEGAWDTERFGLEEAVIVDMVEVRKNCSRLVDVVC